MNRRPQRKPNRVKAVGSSAVLGIGRPPNIMHHSVINDDAIQARPISLPTPALFGAFGLSLDVISRMNRGKRLPTSRTPRTGTNSKSAATLTTPKMRLNLRRDALVRNHVNAFWNLPTVKQCRKSASVTISVCRIIEAVVDEIISELLLAVLAISDVMLSCHALPMPNDQKLSHATGDCRTAEVRSAKLNAPIALAPALC